MIAFGLVATLLIIGGPLFLRGARVSPSMR
jgi:hypothetical protein